MFSAQSICNEIWGFFASFLAYMKCPVAVEARAELAAITAHTPEALKNPD